MVNGDQGDIARLDHLADFDQWSDFIGRGELLAFERSVEYLYLKDCMNTIPPLVVRLPRSTRAPWFGPTRPLGYKV